MARKLRDQLPFIAKQLLPQVITPKKMRNENLLKRKNQKQYFDHHAHELKPLRIGETTSVRRNFEREGPGNLRILKTKVKTKKKGLHSDLVRFLAQN